MTAERPLLCDSPSPTATLSIWALLDADADECVAGVRQCIGDQFLCLYNPIYARLRQMVISLGGGFAIDPSPLREDYNAMPLLMLQHVLDSGTLPVIDNKGVLERLTAYNPQLAVPPSALLSLLKRNFLLHESAHFVAHSVLTSLDTGVRQNKRSYVLTTLLCESYANTVERLASYSCGDSLMHRLFFTLNSYCDPLATSAVMDCTSILPMADLLYMGTIVFFRLNRGMEWSAGEMDCLVSRWAETPGVSLESATLMKLYLHILSTTLNPGFAKKTVPLFFRYMGCETEYDDICSGEKIFDEQFTDELMSRLDELTNKTVEGLRLPALAFHTALPVTTAVGDQGERGEQCTLIPR